VLLLVIFVAHVSGFGVFERTVSQIFLSAPFLLKQLHWRQQDCIENHGFDLSLYNPATHLTHRCLSHDLPLYNMAGSRNSLRYHTTESFFETANVSANSKPNKNCFRTPGAVVL
jgi:hypothetical protein